MNRCLDGSELPALPRSRLVCHKFKKVREQRIKRYYRRSDAGWANAVAGADYVLHVAELVRPARDGTLRVLKASRDAG